MLHPKHFTAIVALICCVAFLGGCKSIAQRAISIGGDDIVNETVAIKGGEYWSHKLTLPKESAIVLNVTVKAGSAVDVDLMDEADFRGYPLEFEYYKDFRARSVVRKEYPLTKIKANHTYVLVIRPSDNATTHVDISIKAFVKPDDN